MAAMRQRALRAAGVVLAAMLLASGGVALAVHNLANAGMWWDESAQFWVSQGLSNYSPPFAERRSLRDVVRANCRENLDPGGFSLLLHAWTALGRGLTWLRALPFAFLLLAAAALGALGWRLTRSVCFALAAGSVPAMFPAVLYFGFEIRAYSMEMAGIAVGALALVYALERPSPGRAAALGVVCAAFLSSRYSFALFVVALACAFAATVVRGPAGAKMRWRRLAALLLPIAAAAALGWRVTLRHQWWPEMRSAPLGVGSPAYTRGSVLGHSGHDAALLGRNLASLPALPLTVCALYVALARRRLWTRVAGPAQDAPAERARRIFSALYAAILGTVAASVVASLLGVYPWDIASRWSAYLVMVAALAVVVVAAEAVALGRIALERRPAAAAVARRAAAALAFAVVAAASAHALAYRYVVRDPHRAGVAAQIDRLPVASLRDRSVFVRFYQAPVLRYLYEYGPYAGRGEYPASFRFETPQEWWAKAPVDAARDGIAFVVGEPPLAGVQARFPGATLLLAEPAGSSLLAVVPSGAGGPGGR